MAEEQTSPEQSSNEQTLEQVYKTFNVDETANEFQPQQRQEVQPQQQAPQPSLGSEIPDPVLDQAGFKSWLGKQDLAIKQALAQSTQFQQQLWIREQRRTEEADIRSAVQAVKEKGVDMDDDFIEIALGQKARKDPKFMKVYNDRNKNPNAWKAALNAVASEFKGKFQFRQDPQLTENVRAARQSTQTSLTSKEASSENSIEAELAGAKNQGEFDRIWAKYRGM